MSGAQGAQPKGSVTATGYAMAPGAGTEKSREGLHSTEDAGGVAIVSEADGVQNAAGLGGPVFGDPATTEAAEKRSPVTAFPPPEATTDTAQEPPLMAFPPPGAATETAQEPPVMAFPPPEAGKTPDLGLSG